MKSATTFKYLLCLAFLGVLSHSSISLYAQVSEDTSQRQAEKFKMAASKTNFTSKDSAFSLHIINTFTNDTVKTWIESRKHFPLNQPIGPGLGSYKLTNNLFLIERSDGNYRIYNAEKEKSLPDAKLNISSRRFPGFSSALNCQRGYCPFKTIALYESKNNTLIFIGHNSLFGLFDQNLDTLLSPKYEWIKDSEYPNLVIVEKDSTSFVYDLKKKKKITKDYKKLGSLDVIKSFSRRVNNHIQGYAPIKGFITEDGILDLNGNLKFPAKNGCIRFYEKYFTVKKVATNQVNLYTYDFEKINETSFVTYQHINDTLGVAYTQDLSARFFHIPSSKFCKRKFKSLWQPRYMHNKLIFSKSSRPSKHTILGKKVAEKLPYNPYSCSKHQMPYGPVSKTGTFPWVPIANPPKWLPTIKINRKRQYGIVNLKEETLLEAKYAEIIAERNGYAVKKNNEWTILDKEFKSVESGIKDRDKMWNILHSLEKDY